LSRPFPFIATHSLAGCDKGKQDQQTHSPSQKTLQIETTGFSTATATSFAPLDSPGQQSLFVSNLPVTANLDQNKESAAHQRTRRGKKSQERRATGHHSFCLPGTHTTLR
jgi:hypothetical protein